MVAIGIGGLIVAGVTAYFAYDASNSAQASARAADLANEITVAKFQYDTDPMMLTDRQRDILGLNNGPIATLHPDGTVSWSYQSGQPAPTTPPPGMFISIDEWMEHVINSGFWDVGGSGGGGGGIIA